MTTPRRVLRYDGPNDYEISFGPTRVDPVPVNENMLLKAHAEFVRLRAFLKAHDFMDGPKDGKNPFIGESHLSLNGVPDPNPPDWLVEILVRRVARTLRAEPSITQAEMWERLGRPVSWTRFRGGRKSIWAKAHALNGKTLGLSNRGRKIGWRKKI
jgi:hypothetical protein